jgi:hypothetical protein
MIRNMTPFDEVAQEIDELFAEAKNWCDGEPLKTAQQHDEVTALYDALHAAGKKADTLREAEKAPLDEQVKAIQAKFHPLIGDTKAGKGKVVLGKASLNTLLAAYREEQARIKREAAEKARREAEEERRKAEEAIRASAGNLEERERAEEQLALAHEAQVFAARQEKRADTGNGLRTVPVVALTNLYDALRHYYQANPAPFEALVIELARADARAGKRTIPGFTVTEEKRAI